MLTAASAATSKVHGLVFRRAPAEDDAPDTDITGERRKSVVLNRWTLRFKSCELEYFYMQHYWENMSYWLIRSVGAVVCYTAVAVILGDVLLFKAFDARMENYNQGLLTNEKLSPIWQEDEDYNSGNGTNTQFGLEDWGVVLPSWCFAIWHALWCIFFVAILIVDRQRSRLFTADRRRWWIKKRCQVVFGIMVFDLFITSFLNPSVVRFMLFVYVLLLRVQFIQAVCLVCVSIFGMMSAGYFSSHSFLSSVSVGEFMILCLICTLASRQIEIHSRLSLYRLWFILSSLEQQPRHAVFQPSQDPYASNVSRKLLSLDEICLPVIPESELVDVDDEAGNIVREDSEAGVISGGGCLTPRSEPSSDSYLSIGSFGDRVKAPLPSLRGPDMIRRTGNVPAQIPPSPCRSNSGSRVGCSPGHSELGSNGPPVFNWKSLSTFPPDAWPEPEGGRKFKRSARPEDMAASSWNDIPDVGAMFKLRGANYLTDKQKIPCPPCAFTLLDFRAYEYSEALFHAAERVASLHDFISAHKNHFFFVWNRCIPIKDKVVNFLIVFYRTLPAGEDPGFDTLFDKCVHSPAQEPAEFRNSRFKYVFNVTKAPGFVSRSFRLIGGTRPMIVGKKGVDQRHFSGFNYVEVDLDVTSSRIAQMTGAPIVKHADTVVMDEMMVLEGQESNELPERPIAGIRTSHFDVERSCVALRAEHLRSPAEA